MFFADSAKKQAESVQITLRPMGLFFRLTSKNPPFGSTLYFDADVKKTIARHQCENRLKERSHPQSSAHLKYGHLWRQSNLDECETRCNAHRWRKSGVLPTGEQFRRKVKQQCGKIFHCFSDLQP